MYCNYFSLKKHSEKEQSRKQNRISNKKEDRATATFGVDVYTRTLMYKMVGIGFLQRVNGVISIGKIFRKVCFFMIVFYFLIGKEAVIIQADCNPNFPNVKEPLPSECVLKVLKTTLAEFKRRDEYIKDDHRFKDRIGGFPKCLSRVQYLYFDFIVRETDI